MRTVKLNEAESESLLAIMEKTDNENAAIGVSGPEVAEYNLRVLKLRLVRGEERERQEAEHEAHVVTKKIRAYEQNAPKRANQVQE